MESCRLHDEQLPQSPMPGDDHVPVGDLTDDPAIRGRAVVRLRAADDLRDTEFLPQHPIEMREETLRAFLAVGDEPDGLAAQRTGPRGKLAERRRAFVGGVKDVESS